MTLLPPRKDTTDDAGLVDVAAVVVAAVVVFPAVAVVVAVAAAAAEVKALITIISLFLNIFFSFELFCIAGFQRSDHQ